MNILTQVNINSDGFTWPNNGKYTWDALCRELDHLSHLLPHLQKTNVMIQAGGNCGLIVKQFINTFKAIYTFEPDPVNFYCLNINLPFTNVNKIQACIGNEYGMVDLVQPHQNDVGSYYVTAGSSIPTLKIDDLNLNECDLIMLDIEGYELNALKGGENTILKYKPVLCIEIFEPWLNRFNVTADDIDKYITNTLGYVKANIYSSDQIYIPK